MENTVKIKGLNNKEVEKRVSEGKVNTIPKLPSRTLGQILRANIVTSYNILNLGLALVMVLIGTPKNAVFAIIVIVNIIAGAFQELHAKSILEKLSVINNKRAYVLRNGEVKNISVDEIVLDDIIFLRTGDQILVDCEMIEDTELEVDESMITGESDNILKRKGDTLLSGSVVTTGQGYAKAIRVGEDTYAAKLASEARKFKVINSELQRATNKIFKVIMWMILPLAILLMISQLKFSHVTTKEALIGAVSGIIGMVPEGIILLTSTTFLIAVIKLSKWDTLVQELPATEVLARVDVLCLDKTGTITKGDLKVSEILPFENESLDEVEKIISSIVYSFKSRNQTDKAIIEKFPKNYNLQVKNKIPFSSKRKWSAVEFEKEGTWILGAPEVVLKKDYNEIETIVKKSAKEGKRVLLLARFKGKVLDEYLNGDIEKVALIFIEDIIRENAEEAIEYFNKENVTIKIISGDNPITVSAIAKKVGVRNAEYYINAKDLPQDEEELRKVVEKTCVFGRVTPHDKKRIVTALKENEHTVAMTGDGVNDVLALKEADCGIAMASGADATKAVAQLVLMNSDFSALPHVVLEGRQLINNLEKVSELFLSKIVYFIVLCVAFGVMAMPFPITPIQLTLLGSLTIGIPSFFLAMAPNRDVIKKNFLKRVLQESIPNGLLIGLSVTFVFATVYKNNIPLEECRSIALVVFTILGLAVLTKISRPLNLFRVLMIIAMAGLFACSFYIPFVRKFFALKFFSPNYWCLILITSIIAIIAMGICAVMVKKFIEKNN